MPTSYDIYPHQPPSEYPLGYIFSSLERPAMPLLASERTTGRDTYKVVTIAELLP
jgi:hypothetical protein